MCHIKVKDVLDIHKWGGGPFGLSLLTDKRLKGLNHNNFVYIFQQWAFLCLRMTCGTFYFTYPNTRSLTIGNTLQLYNLPQDNNLTNLITLSVHGNIQSLKSVDNII